MRVFEAPEQTREAILGKYRQRLERNDKSEVKAFDKAIGSGTVRGSGLYHSLNDPVRTLLALNAISTDDDGLASFDLEGVTEVAVEWLCNQFVPLKTFGSYYYSHGDVESLIYPEDLPRALQTWRWYLDNRKDSRIQQQFVTMFPQVINDGGSPKNPLSWTCYQMEDVQDALTPESIGTERNQRWRPDELGWEFDQAGVIHDDDGWMIIKIQDSSAAADYGRGTRWCTSNKSTAQHYLDQGPLFVVFHNGRKFLQAHYDGEEEVMVMDVRDRSIDHLEHAIGKPLGDAMFGSGRESVTDVLETSVDDYIAEGKIKAQETLDTAIRRLEKSMEVSNLMQSANRGLSRFMDRIVPVSISEENQIKRLDAEQRYQRAISKLNPADVQKQLGKELQSVLKTLATSQVAIMDNLRLFPESCLSSTNMDRDLLSKSIGTYHSLVDTDTIPSDWYESHVQRRIIFYLVQQAVRNDYHSANLDDLFTLFLRSFIKKGDYDDVSYFGTRFWPTILDYGDLIPEGDPMRTQASKICNEVLKHIEENELSDDDDILLIPNRSSYLLTTEPVGSMQNLVFELLTDMRDDSMRIPDFCNGISNIVRNLVNLEDDDLMILRPLAPTLERISVAITKTIAQVDRLGPDFEYTVVGGDQTEVDIQSAISDWLGAVKRSRTKPQVGRLRGESLKLQGPDYDGDYTWYADLSVVWPDTLDALEIDWEWESSWFAEGEMSEENALEDLRKTAWFMATRVNIDSLNDPGLSNNNSWRRVAPPFALYHLLQMIRKRFGDDCLENLTGKMTGSSSLIDRINEIPWIAGRTFSDSIDLADDPIPLIQFATSEMIDAANSRLPQGYLMTDGVDADVHDSEVPLVDVPYTDYIDRVSVPVPRPSVAGAYGDAGIMAYRPDDFPELSTEVFEVINGDGELSDDLSMQIFRGYFVEPLIPTQDRIVRQVNAKNLSRPPAVMGYVCYTCKRPVEYDTAEGRWLTPEIEDPGRDVWNRSRNNCENRGISHVLAAMPTRGVPYLPIRAQSLWCTVCLGVRANPPGMAWPTTDYSRSSGSGGRRCSCGYAKSNDRQYE